MLGGRPRHRAKAHDRRAFRHELALVAAPRLIGKHPAHIVGFPLDLVACQLKLRQGEIAKRGGVGAHAHSAAHLKHAAVLHQAIEVGQAAGRALLLGKRRREVDKDACKLPFAEQLENVRVLIV